MTSKNPPDFPKRLRLLMDGEGWSTRDLADKTGGRVSHSTINSWMNDVTRAGADQVAVVAEVFGWSVEELYYGRGGTDSMNRLAEIDGALRSLKHILERLVASATTAGVLEVREGAKSAGAKPLPRRAGAGGE